MPSAVHAAPVVMNGLVYAATCATCGSAAARSVKTGVDSTTAFDASPARRCGSPARASTPARSWPTSDRAYLIGRSYIYAMENSGSKTRAARQASGAGKDGGAAGQPLSPGRRASARPAQTREATAAPIIGHSR